MQCSSLCLRDDRHQFVHSMSARVTGANASKAVPGQIARHFFVTQKREYLPLHVGAVFCYEKIAAWLEKIFGVMPWRTNERNSASESFKRTNGGNAQEETYVRTQRHTPRHPKTRKNFRNAIIGYPAAVRNSRIAQHIQRYLRVTHAENLAAQAKAFNR